MIPERIVNILYASKSLPFRSMTFFNFLLEATLAGSILIIILLILRKVLRKQLGNRLVYIAWALVALRLLMPIALPNPLMDEFRPTNSIDAEARPVADQFRVRYQDTLSDMYYKMVLTEPPAAWNETPLSQLVFDVGTYTHYGWLGKAYLLMYALGALITASVFWARHFRKKTKASWQSALIAVCCAIHWFNPFVWVARRFAKKDGELAQGEQALVPKKIPQMVIASFFVLLTLASFFTAESTAQQKRLTTDTSAFPLSQNDTYAMPEITFGDPVPLLPAATAQEAEASAKRYLLALFPNDKTAIETQYSYHAQIANENRWWIDVWPPEGGETPCYYLNITSAGELFSVRKITSPYSGAIQTRFPLVLPTNLKAALPDYGKQVSDTALQGLAFENPLIHSNMENAYARFLSYGSDAQADITVQIAPSFQLIGVRNNAIFAPDASEAPPIDKGERTLTYSKEPAITFNARYDGQTDNWFAIPNDAVLTVQQVFDLAVDTMLEKSGLTIEALRGLTLSYGYRNEKYFGNEVSLWEFKWQVDSGKDDNFYWVDFYDIANPSVVNYIVPGQGLG